MGLDMFAFRVSNVTPDENDPGAVVFEEKDLIDRDFAYWRKFNALHGWMNDLYIRKGGVSEFNCVNLELTSQDLMQLEYAVHTRSLEPTSGFFFGPQDPVSDEEYDEVSSFISECLPVIEAGDHIVYSSWW